MAEARLDASLSVLSVIIISSSSLTFCAKYYSTGNLLSYSSNVKLKDMFCELVLSFSGLLLLIVTPPLGHYVLSVSSSVTF